MGLNSEGKGRLRNRRGSKQHEMDDRASDGRCNQSLYRAEKTRIEVVSPNEVVIKDLALVLNTMLKWVVEIA
jgi:hypothetical protein